MVRRVRGDLCAKSVYDYEGCHIKALKISTICSVMSTDITQYTSLYHFFVTQKVIAAVKIDPVVDNW